jgi:hypothetical protein
MRDGHDPWFGLPLVLAEPIGDHLLWARNAAHVESLIEWIGADLRERALGSGNHSMATRLPLWMKLAGARPRVLRALEKLRERAAREGLA